MDLNHQNCGWHLGAQPFGHGEPIRGRVRHLDPRGHPTIHRRRQHRLDALQHRAPIAAGHVLGGADIAHVRDDLFAPSNIQLEQSQALPGVATIQTTDNQYFNYSINLIHHYTGLSWLDATTSAGFVRERR